MAVQPGHFEGRIATAADEAPHVDGWTGELWENHGWCLRLSGGGREYLLWVAFYLIRGEPGGRFTVDDVRIAQSIAVEAPSGAADVLGDAAFHVSGVNWSEYQQASALAWELGERGAVWRLAGREHVSDPPRWRIRGTAGPYELDLDLTALAPVSWFDGFDLIRGYEALARVSGTLHDASGTRQVSGFGQHEKVHTGTAIQRTDRAGFDSLPVERRHMWHCFAGERLAMTLLANQPGEQPDRLNGHLVVDGRSHHFSRDRLEVAETGQWRDPSSGVTVPTGWRLGVDTDGGRMEVAVTARARAYYLWDYIKGSTSLLYWFLCDGEVTWRPSGGRPVTEVVPYVGHTNRPFLYWG